MGKFFAVILVAVLSIATWNSAAQAADKGHVGKIDLSLYAALKVNSPDATIVDPFWVDTNDPSSWAWIVYNPVTGGAEVKLLAFSFGWLPTSGYINVERINGASADSIFSTGFENVPLTGSGVIDASWWFGGPPNYQTDRVFGTLAPGRYQAHVNFTNGTGVGFFYTNAKFNFTIP